MDKKRDRLARQVVFVLGIGSLAGVLIWSKLRLVTDIPRSAYAEPEDEAQGVRSDAPDAGVAADRAPGPSPARDASGQPEEHGSHREDPAPLSPAGAGRSPDPAASDPDRDSARDG